MQFESHFEADTNDRVVGYRAPNDDWMAVFDDPLFARFSEHAAPYLSSLDHDD